MLVENARELHEAELRELELESLSHAFDLASSAMGGGGGGGGGGESVVGEVLSERSIYSGAGSRGRGRDGGGEGGEDTPESVMAAAAVVTPTVVRTGRDVEEDIDILQRRIMDRLEHSQWNANF
jgi:hypothetical protein